MAGSIDCHHASTAVAVASSNVVVHHEGAVGGRTPRPRACCSRSLDVAAVVDADLERATERRHVGDVALDGHDGQTVAPEQHRAGGHRRARQCDRADGCRDPGHHRNWRSVRRPLTSESPAETADPPTRRPGRPADRRARTPRPLGTSPSSSRPSDSSHASPPPRSRCRTPRRWRSRRRGRSRAPRGSSRADGCRRRRRIDVDRSRQPGTSPIIATTGAPSTVATTVPACTVSPAATTDVTVPAAGEAAVTESVNPRVAVVSS